MCSEKVDAKGVKVKKEIGGDVNPITKKQTKARRRCGYGTKSVHACCVTPLTLVQVPIPQALQDDLSFARDYLRSLPQRIREVQQVADAVLKAGEYR
jgi:hypothetical protein